MGPAIGTKRLYCNVSVVPLIELENGRQLTD
jgi:hypothetical protein